MTTKEYLAFIVEHIHSTVVATVDDEGLPVTCVIDMMHSDESGLYFLTAKGKNFYDRLKKREYLALSGMKGEDTMHCVAVSVRGKVKEVGTDMLSLLFEKDPYMREIYPTDTGSGISPEAVPHIFEKGYTTDEGSGLGLAICKETVELHGGTLELVSTGSEGTTFSFTVPIYRS